MNELVFRSEKGNPITSSLLVAEKFGKEHRHVLDTIRNLVAENSAAKPYFFESEYENRGKMYPMYIMNRDGFSLLVMGFTGTKALQFKLDFIDAFNKMEQTIKTGSFAIPQSFPEALRLAAEQAEKNAALQQVIERQAPKVLFADAVQGSGTNITVEHFAKILCQNGIVIGQNRLFDWFVKNKYLIRHQRWSNKKQKYINDYTPTQTAADLKVFFVTTTSINPAGADPFLKHTVKITGKGQMYFINKFKINHEGN